MDTITLKQYFYRKDNEDQFQQMKHEYLSFITWFSKNSYAQLVMSKEFKELDKYGEYIMNEDFGKFMLDRFNELSEDLKEAIEEYEKENGTTQLLIDIIKKRNEK